MFVGKVFRPDLYFILLNFGLSRGKLRMLFLFRLKNFLGNSVFRDVPVFLFFDHKDVPDFLEFYLKLFFFFSTTNSFPKFWAPFHLEAFGNGLIGLVEGPALHIDLIASQSQRAWMVNFDYLEEKKWQISSSKFFLFFEFIYLFYFIFW